MRTLTVCFQVIGCVTQEIEIADDCFLTNEQIVDGLNGQLKDSLCTCLEPGGPLLLFAESDIKPIGRVLSMNPDAEYTDFEIVEDEPTIGND